MSKITPGPWTVSEILDDGNFGIVAFDVIVVGSTRNLSLTNATAIAAVPDLIEALQRSLSWLSSYPGGNALATYDQARAALRKAGVE